MDPHNFPIPERPLNKGKVLNEEQRPTEHDLLFEDPPQISDGLDKCRTASRSSNEKCGRPGTSAASVKETDSPPELK